MIDDTTEWPIGRRRPRMAEIARIAGVDISTVSRALAGSPRVTKETRARIDQIVRDTGYVVNEKARALRDGRGAGRAVGGGNRRKGEHRAGQALLPGQDRGPWRRRAPPSRSAGWCLPHVARGAEKTSPSSPRSSLRQPAVVIGSCSDSPTDAGWHPRGLHSESGLRG